MDRAILDSFSEELNSLYDSNKIRIESLTQYAKTHENLSAEISNIIARRITEAPPGQKLPSLYLLDSIVKNHGEPWISRFSPILARLFSSVYQSSDSNEKRLARLLLPTWIGKFPKEIMEVIQRELEAEIWIPDLVPDPNRSFIYINYPKFHSYVESFTKTPYLQTCFKERCGSVSQISEKNYKQKDESGHHNEKSSDSQLHELAVELKKLMSEHPDKVADALSSMSFEDSQLILSFIQKEETKSLSSRSVSDSNPISRNIQQIALSNSKSALNTQTYSAHLPVLKQKVAQLSFSNPISLRYRIFDSSKLLYQCPPIQRQPEKDRLNSSEYILKTSDGKFARGFLLSEEEWIIGKKS